MKKINQQSRAREAWDLLVQLAKTESKMKITYGELAGQMGLHHRATQFFLHEILKVCEFDQLPPLTSIVISKSTGMPGAGFLAWYPGTVQQAYEAVYTFDWDSVRNPFDYTVTGLDEEALIKGLANSDSSAVDAVSKIESRGYAQQLFRKALMQLYESRCSVCGFGLEPALEAAHIKPWARSSLEERVDPQNGILLCSTHHRLFDAGWLTIDEDFMIHVWDYSDPDLNRTERRQYSKFEGRLLKVVPKTNMPNPQSLHAHHLSNLE